MVQVHQPSDPIKRKSQKITQNVHINKKICCFSQKNLFEKKKSFTDIPKALGQSFPTHSHCVLQISIPTYIHRFLVLSQICHRNNKLNVPSLNTRNKNLWIAGDLRICSVTDEKKKSFVKKLKCVFIQSSSIHTHTYIPVRTAQCQHYSVYDIQVQLVQVKIKMLPFVTPVPEPAD